MTWRSLIYELIEDEERPHALGRPLHRALVALILISVTGAILDSEPAINAAWGGWLAALEYGCVGVFTVEYAARIWVCVEDRAGRYVHPVRGRLRYALTPLAIIDLAAILPTWLGFLFPETLIELRLLRLLRILRLGRFSPALATFEIVLVNERRALLSALTVLLTALMLAATVMHWAERDAQPEAFGSIPAAMWWAVVTLTTLGYGDVVPVTGLGRLVAGVSAVIGVMMIALPTAILGAGFARELHKTEFVDKASMVARVPLFRHLAPAQLAEVTALLIPRHLPARYTIIRRGEHPEAMYFLDQGRVVMRLGERRVTLGPGAFFGEMALLEGRERQVTVITLGPCRLLELDANDFHRLIGGDPVLRETILAEARLRDLEQHPAHHRPASAGSERP
jgi:voltage-gated potassium channel